MNQIGIYGLVCKGSTSSFLIKAFRKVLGNRCQVLSASSMKSERVLLDFCKEPSNTIIFIDPIGNWYHAFSEFGGTKICYLVDTHRDFVGKVALARQCQLSFVAQKDHVTRLARWSGRNAVWLPLAADKDVHFQTSVGKERSFAFVGRLDKKDQARFNVILGVAEQFPDGLIAQGLNPIKMAEEYARSRVILNCSVGGDLNMRVFEALASGGILVTDRISNGLSDLFEEGLHYFCYDDVEDAKQLIHAIMTWDEDRLSHHQRSSICIAEAHIYDDRVARLLEHSNIIDDRAYNWIDGLWLSLLLLRVGRRHCICDANHSRLVFTYRKVHYFLAFLVLMRSGWRVAKKIFSLSASSVQRF